MPVAAHVAPDGLRVAPHRASHGMRASESHGEVLVLGGDSLLVARAQQKLADVAEWHVPYKQLPTELVAHAAEHPSRHNDFASTP